MSKIRVTFYSYENIPFRVQREFEDEYWDEFDDQEKEETVAEVAEEWLYDIINWDWEVVDD